MNTYFRITAYHPALDISFIIDSANQYDAMWKFSADLVKRKCKIVAVSNDTQFEDGNIPKVLPNGTNYILRACTKGKIELQSNRISIQGRWYKPNMP